MTGCGGERGLAGPCRLPSLGFPPQTIDHAVAHVPVVPTTEATRVKDPIKHAYLMPCGGQILTWPRLGQSSSHPWPGACTGLLPEGKAENNWKPGGWSWASPSSTPKPVSCLANVSSPIRPETAQCPMASHITHSLCPPPPLRNQSLRKGLIITLKWKLPTKLSVSYQRVGADFNRVCGKTLLRKFQA